MIGRKIIFKDANVCAYNGDSYIPTTMTKALSKKNNSRHKQNDKRKCAHVRRSGAQSNKR